MLKDKKDGPYGICTRKEDCREANTKYALPATEARQFVIGVNLLSVTLIRPLRGRFFVVHLHIEKVCGATLSRKV